MNIRLLSLTAVLLSAGLGLAHDTWVQTNTNLVRVGDVVRVDLMLGNHGNEHRDFKLAGKVKPGDVTLDLIDPAGKTRDLKPLLQDTGLGEKDGYLTATVPVSQPGLYAVVQTSDKVVSYAPTRSVKSAKTFFVASKSLDQPPVENPGFDRVLGHPLELVPLSNPVTPMGPGERLKVRVLFKGKPLASHRVTLVPRGVTLKEGRDSRYEHDTDADGVVSFDLNDANLYLLAVHQQTDEAGKGFTSTKYSATMTVWVPALCPCCGE